MGFFRAAHEIGDGQKGPPKTCHTFPTMLNSAWILNSEFRIIDFCLHEDFFTRNQQLLLYQEIQILTAF